MGASLAVAGIIAAVSLIAGGVVSGISVNQENEQAEKDKNKAIEMLNRNEKDDLDLLNLKLEESTKDLELSKKQQLETLQHNYEQNVKDAKLNFEVEKAEANRSADRSDKQMDFSERALSDSFNTQIGQLQINQMLNGLAYNAQSVSMGQQKGSELAAMAGNGTRAGSSLSQAVEMEGAMNAYSMQMQQNAQRQGDKLGINQALRGVQSSMFDIGNARNDADYLRGQYEQGGNKYALMENQLGNFLSNYNLGANQTNESFLRNLENLNNMYNQEKTNMANYYTRARENAEYDYSKFTSDENTNMRFMKGMFNTGTAVNNFAWQSYSNVKYFGK